MSSHIAHQCPHCKNRIPEKEQTTLCFLPRKDSETGGNLVPMSFIVEACRKALAEMLIIDELPCRFVERERDSTFNACCLS